MAKYRSPIGLAFLQGLPNFGAGIAQGMAKRQQEEEQMNLLNQVLNAKDPRAIRPASEMGYDLEQEAFQPRPLLSQQNLPALSRLDAPTLNLLQGIFAANQPSYFNLGEGEKRYAQPPGGAPPFMVAQGQPRMRAPSFLQRPMRDAQGKLISETIPGTDDVRVRQEYVDPATGESPGEAPLATGGAPPSMFAGARIATNLRKQFISEPTVKYFNEILPRFQTMATAFESAKKTNNFVAIDQALITLFNKMTDPESVVRESEYARTPEDLSWLARFDALRSRVTKGGRLEPDAREALIKMAQSFYEVAAEKYAIARQDYDYNAKSLNLDSNVVLGTDLRSSVKFPQFSGETPSDSLETMTDEQLDTVLKQLEGGR